MRLAYVSLAGVALMTIGMAHASVPAPPTSAGAQVLQRWLPGEVRCSERTFTGAQLRRPYTTLFWSTQAPAPRTYHFKIDQRGYPVSITGGGDWEFTAADIAPSLAASHLPVTAPLSDCTVTYTADPKLINEAPLGDLVSYSITPLNGELPPEGWARIRPEGADCDKEPRAQWLKVVLPDYLKMPGEPGAKDWSLIGYDLDAKGRPTHLKQQAGTGDVALERAALTSMAQSRQTQGPRKGCLNPFSRMATRLAAPADVDPETLKPADSTCPYDPSAAWETMPALVYPENWRRRAVEGWAILAFDVAPWGATGNVRVLASEPSDEFGKAAVPIVAGAVKRASTKGMVGCVERVRFKMGPGTPEPLKRG